MTASGERKRPESLANGSSKPFRLPWLRSDARPKPLPEQAALDEVLQGAAGPQAAVQELLGERQLWWKCCSEAFRADPSWFLDGRGQERRAWLDATTPDRAADFITSAEHAWLLGRSLTASEDEALARLTEAWRRSGLISADAVGPAHPSGQGLDRLLPRVAAGVRAVVDRLQDLDSPSNGPRAMLVIAALLMAGMEPRRKPVVRVPVVFGRTGQPTPEEGVTGILELREFRAGPAGLYPDPRTMVGVHSPNGQFAASLGRAWQAAGSRREGRCVLWRLVPSDGPAPPAWIEGPSLGAAFALGLRDLVRYPSSRRLSVAWIRDIFYGRRPRTAVTGTLDADERLLRVGGMDAKLLAARRKGLWLVVPEANRLDLAAASEPGRVRFAANLRQADRYARRLRAGRLVVAALVLIASTAGGFALQQRGSARSAQRAAIANRIAAQADQLRGTDPSLAARIDVTAYHLSPTGERYARLVGDANRPLSRVLNAFSSGVNSISVSPNGHTLAAVGFDDGDKGTLRLWDMTNPAHPSLLGRPLRNLIGVGSVAFSPDGRTLATGGTAGTEAVRLWNVTDPAHPVPLGRPFAFTISDVVFSPDGHTLATGGNNTDDEQLWDVTDLSHPVRLGKPIHHGAAVDAVAFSPDGHTLATYSPANAVRLWNVTNPAHAVLLSQLSPDETREAGVLDFSPDGRTLATGDNGNVELWNVAHPSHPVLLDTPLTGFSGYIGSMAFSPNGRTLAATSDRTVKVWNVADPAHPTPLANPLAGHSDDVSSMVFSPDGRTLITSSNDHTVRLWNLSAAVLTNHTGIVDSTVFSPDGRILATTSGDNTVRLWNVADPGHPTPLSQIRGFTANILSAVFSPDGRTLATAVNGENRVLLWNVANPARPTVLAQLVNLPSDESSVAFSPHGHTLATNSSTSITGEKNIVLLWNVTDPAHPTLLGRPLPNPLSVVSFVTFSPDGRTLAEAGGFSSGTVRLWDVTDPAHPAPFQHPIAGGGRSMVFSPDGHTLAIVLFSAVAGTPGDGTVRLWNVSDRSHPAFLSKLPASTSPVRAVAFSPDGRTVATAGTGVRLWNVADLAHPAAIGQPIDVYDSRVSSVAFAPNGDTLATGGDDDTVRLWQLEVDQAIQQICAGTDAPTRQQWQQYLSELPYRSSCG